MKPYRREGTPPVPNADDWALGSATIQSGTAAWSIQKEHAAAFLVAGSHLERYGAVFDAVEINSSFYRPHRTTTYECTLAWTTS